MIINPGYNIHRRKSRRIKDNLAFEIEHTVPLRNQSAVSAGTIQHHQPETDQGYQYRQKIIIKKTNPAASLFFYSFLRLCPSVCASPSLSFFFSRFGSPYFLISRHLIYTPIVSIILRYQVKNNLKTLKARTILSNLHIMLLQTIYRRRFTYAELSLPYT